MLEALSGRDWAQLAPVLRAPPSAVPPRTSATSSFARLPEEDMDLFGLAPTSDPLLLVVCSRCARHIKASRFSSHYERCSKREEEEKIPPKRMRLEVTEADDAPAPSDSPKRTTSAPSKAKTGVGSVPSQPKRSSSAVMMTPANSGGVSGGLSTGGRRKSEVREWSGSESESSGDESGGESSAAAAAGVAVLVHAGAWAVAPLRTRLYCRPNPLRRAPPLPPAPSLSLSASSLVAPPIPFHSAAYYSSPASASTLGPAHHAAAPALKPPAMVAAGLQMRKLTAPTPMPPKLAPASAGAAVGVAVGVGGVGGVRPTDGAQLDANLAKKMGERKPAAASTVSSSPAEAYTYASPSPAYASSSIVPSSVSASSASSVLASASPVPTVATSLPPDYARATSLAVATRAVGTLAPPAAPPKAPAKAPTMVALANVPPYKPASVPVPVPLPLSSSLTASAASPSPLQVTSGTPLTSPSLMGLAPTAAPALRK